MNQHSRSSAYFIFGFLLACYLLTYTGIIQSSDGLSMFATAENLVRRGEIDSNQLLWMGLQQGSFGPDGSLYGRKGLGMVLLSWPLLWLAHWWQGIGLARAALLLNPLLIAWTGALIYRLGWRLGWSQRAATLTALTFGLGTLAWPYTQEFFSDPVCAWGLFASLYALAAYRQNGSIHYLLVAGLTWGIAYLTRTINLITLPIFALALLWLVREQGQANNSAEKDQPTSQRWSLLRQVGEMFWFAAPVLLSGVISLWWNWLRYANVWDSGYVESERFSADWLFGITGLLVGPARGLLWYSPVLLLAIPGAIWFWRNVRWLLLVSLAITLLYLLTYGKWFMWHGGYSWGPRFLVPTLPFLALLCGPVWQWLLEGRQTSPTWQMRLGWLATILLTVLSLLIQWLGMLVPFGLVQDWLAATVSPLFAPETFTQWQYSPLLRQWDHLNRDSIFFAWWHGADGIDWLGLTMPLSGVLIGLILLIADLRGAVRGQLGGASRRWLYSVALVLIALALVTYRVETPDSTALQTVTAQVKANEQAGDAILHLVPQEAQQFADLYSGTLPVYGFTMTAALDEQQKQWLQRLRQTYRRLWVVPAGINPGESAWEQALRFDDFVVAEGVTELPAQRRWALYSVATAAEMSEVVSGARFVPLGHQAEDSWVQLRGYALTQRVAPSGVILLALRWESLRRIEYDYHVFVHLLQGKDRLQKVMQRDGQPVYWLRPTSTWQPGEQILDRYAFPLPADLPAGEYDIVVGFYDPINGQRLPVVPTALEDAIQIGPIIVHNP